MEVRAIGTVLLQWNTDATAHSGIRPLKDHYTNIEVLPGTAPRFLARSLAFPNNQAIVFSVLPVRVAWSCYKQIIPFDATADFET